MGLLRDDVEAEVQPENKAAGRAIMTTTICNVKQHLAQYDDRTAQTAIFTCISDVHV